MAARITRSLTPLGVNLAVAVVLRLVLPLTLADGGERFRYYGLSLFSPLPGCPSFHCFRLLPPLFVSLASSLLPLETADAFIGIGVLFHILAATALWYLALHIHQSTRVAWWTIAWYWGTWGSIQSLTDPLLIADPLQAFWSFATLYLLMRGRDVTAFLMLVTGAGVKESILLVPMIYGAYVFLANDPARRRLVRLAVLAAAPIATWGLLRYWLHAQYGYVTSEDQGYLRNTYSFGVWLPNLAPWPSNLGVAALYIFGSFGAAWILAPFGLWRSARPQRALTAAAIPAMAFLAVYQVPDRALASFPYAVLMPAAAFTAGVPPLVGAFTIAATAGFTIRMNAAVGWLPRMPFLLLAIAVGSALALWAGRRRTAGSGAGQHADRVSTGSDPVALLARLILSATAVIAGTLIFRDLRHGAPARLALLSDPVRIADDKGDTPGLAVSPDGRRIVFVGKDRPELKQLWIQAIASGVPRALAGTDGASEPFWAPDGRRLGFFAAGRLKSIDLATSHVTELADAPEPRGGTWSARDIILFAPSPADGLYAVPANGGPATAVTRVTAPDRASSHRWPSFLPDDDRFLFVKWHGRDEGLFVGSLSSEGTVRVSGDTHGAVYLDRVLLFAREDALHVQPFDLRRTRMFGTPLHLGRVAMTASGRSAFAVGGGTIAVAVDTARANLPVGARQLEWLDRTGKRLGPVGRGELANGVELSPDETSVVMAVGVGTELPFWDLRRPLGPRRTFSTPTGRGPLWSPDGRSVVLPRRVGDEERPRWELIERPSDGGAERVLVGDLPPGAMVTSWSPDGEVLLFHSRRADGYWSTFALRRRPGAQPVPLADGERANVQPQFSPDGRWIAYASDETGQFQVHVQPYPPTGEKFVVTVEGGEQPRWRRDGRELYFVANGRRLMAMEVSTENGFKTGAPRELFEAKFATDAGGFFHEYAVTADGRFLVNTSTSPEPTAHIGIVLNWQGALRSPE